MKLRYTIAHRRGQSYGKSCKWTQGVIHMLSLRVLFCVSIFYAVTIMRALPAQNEPEFEPHKYLPRGAKIQDTRKNMIFADLDGDGLKEVVLFYTLDEGAGRHQANILVLRPKENTYVPIWKDDYEGSWGFIDPSR